MKRWLYALVPLALVLGCAIADARPGGGHSSSGGGRSSSSSGSRSSSSGHSYSGGGYSSSGGGGDLSGGMLIVMIVVIGLFFVISQVARQQSGPDWSSAGADPIPEPAPAASLEPLQRHDPAFSVAVFEDFAFELYAAAQRKRATPALLELQPYLSPAALGQLDARGAAPQQVVIGTLRIENSSLGATRAQILVRIEATLLGTGTPIFAVEHWMFTRGAEAKSHPPERTRTWPCPNCGAPWQPSPTRVCAHCGEAVKAGQFDWCVSQVWVDSESTALASLTGTVPEYGNDLPTVIHPAVSVLMAKITADDPQVTFDTLGPRIMLTYQQLNTAWNARELTPVRGLVTASLRNYLEYWLREYAHQGLRNTLTGAQVAHIDLAKITRDPYYDAITVRIFASGVDCTYDTSDRVVGGSSTERRAYTEYWTFLRSSTRRGPVTATPTCANCGAPLAISDAGECTHCNAFVENGSFDWTLSKIEQDDNYTG
ncbi:MAG: TIM44-like domain-containing protein [Kofleriaceae bacterium]